MPSACTKIAALKNMSQIYHFLLTGFRLNELLMQKPDSLIFDMDGTLWDAVDTYAHSWNVVFEELAIDITVDRDDLAKMVGWEGKKVIGAIMPDFDDERRLEIYAL